MVGVVDVGGPSGPGGATDAAAVRNSANSGGGSSGRSARLVQKRNLKHLNEVQMAKGRFDSGKRPVLSWQPTTGLKLHEILFNREIFATYKIGKIFLTY